MSIRRAAARAPYDRAVELVEPVSARVRALYAVHVVTDHEAEVAIGKNAAAYDALVAAWGVLRRLTEGLGDSACLSKPVDLAAVIAEAEQLLAREGPP